MPSRSHVNRDRGPHAFRHGSEGPQSTVGAQIASSGQNEIQARPLGLSPQYLGQDSSVTKRAPEDVAWFHRPLTPQQDRVLQLLTTAYITQHQWPNWRWLRKQLG